MTGVTVSLYKGAHGSDVEQRFFRDCEMHISTSGVLVLKRDGKQVHAWASGQWRDAKAD